jgi:hypothetical protein
MDVLRIMLYDQPALSPLPGISFIVLLYTPYKWILCSDICCMQIGEVDKNKMCYFTVNYQVLRINHLIKLLKGTLLYILFYDLSERFSKSHDR